MQTAKSMIVATTPMRMMRSLKSPYRIMRQATSPSHGRAMTRGRRTIHLTANHIAPCHAGLAAGRLFATRHSASRAATAGSIGSELNSGISTLSRSKVKIRLCGFTVPHHRGQGDAILNVLVVFDHPRRDSFCGAVLDSVVAGLNAAGHVPEVADLRTEGFDPRLPPADEPDWNDADKVYSDAVLAEQARMMRSDALAFVFPVWWWSLPATTKGWIDRVWNNGWAYGDRKLKHRKALLLGTAAGSGDS